MECCNDDDNKLVDTHVFLILSNSELCVAPVAVHTAAVMPKIYKLDETRVYCHRLGNSLTFGENLTCNSCAISIYSTEFPMEFREKIYHEKHFH